MKTLCGPRTLQSGSPLWFEYEFEEEDVRRIIEDWMFRNGLCPSREYAIEAVECGPLKAVYRLTAFVKEPWEVEA